MSRWFFYVVRCKDDSLYAGVTTDISRRIKEHNSKKGGAKYTFPRRPVELIYSEEHSNRSLAQKEEYRFKQLSRKEKHITISERLLKAFNN
jgi:putative endonuclease